MNRTLCFLLPVLAALAAVFSYFWILDLCMTEQDAWTLIETSRCQNIADCFRLFTQRMMEGSVFPPDYYRPLICLSFALDYEIWGTNPFGYHLTNLLLHGLVALLACILGMRLFGQIPGFLGAILFIVHPILIENVPGVSRRHDLLAAAFLIFCALALIPAAGRFPGTARRFLAGALVIPAVFAKETAVSVAITFALIPFITSEESTFEGRVREAFDRSLPIFGGIGLALITRLFILQGMGGPISPIRPGPIWALKTYALFLLDPERIAGIPGKWFMAVPVLFGAAILVYGVCGLFSRNRKRQWIGFLTAWALVPGLLTSFFGFLAPYYLYMPAIAYGLALGGIISVFIEPKEQNQARKSVDKKNPNAFVSGNIGAVIPKIAGGMALVLALIGIWGSPVTQEFTGWKEVCIVNSRFLGMVGKAMAKLPDDSTGVIPLCPARYIDPNARFAVESASGLSGYAIRSWLKLHGLEKRSDIFLIARYHPGNPVYVNPKVFVDGPLIEVSTEENVSIEPFMDGSGLGLIHAGDKKITVTGKPWLWNTPVFLVIIGDDGISLEPFPKPETVF